MAVKTFTTGEVLTASDTNTYLANAGLVYITSLTWSSTSNAQQINNCFTSTYDNYRITFTGIGNQSTPTGLNFRLVDGTTPDSTANYYYTEMYQTTAGTPSGYWSTGVGQMSMGRIGDNYNAFALDIFSPQTTNPTAFLVQATAFGNSNLYNGNAYGYKNTTTAYEGLYLYIGAGTWAGTLTVMGYRKA